jgi:anti-sigma28 factor (negative regulator of flagellin synthesis)
MGIQEINPNTSPVGPIKNEGPKGKKAKGKESLDSASLSPEAISKFESQHSTRMEDIRGKITSGYYFGKEVTEKVADYLLKDIRKAE